MNYRIGLDIGITSVGWAVLLHDGEDEACKIIDRGVRIFDAAEGAKGESLMAVRRGFRSQRRQTRRRKLRLHAIKALLCQELRMSEAEMQDAYGGKLTDVHILRFKGLDKKLEKQDWLRVLVHLAQRRGFKSNRKNETADKEEGLIKTAIKQNSEQMQALNCRTVGELLYKKYILIKTDGEGRTLAEVLCRNRAGVYEHTVTRAQMEQEIAILFDCQRKLGNPYADKRFEEAYLALYKAQRSFDEGPGQASDGTSKYGKGKDGIGLIERMIGVCTFENVKRGMERDEPRAVKNSYTFERFMLLQAINHLRIKQNGKETPLDGEQRRLLVERAYIKCDLTFEDVRKCLKLSSADEDGAALFSGVQYSKKNRSKEKNAFGKYDYIAVTLSEAERKQKFISLKGYAAIKHCLNGIAPDYIRELSEDRLNDIAYAFTCYKNDERIAAFLSDRRFEKRDIEALADMPSFDKVGHLSVKAMKKINPYLEQGLTYDKACAEAGYDFNNAAGLGKKRLLEFNEIKDELKNPVVIRAVSQTFKVVNAIIKKYGSPQLICIELAREMAKSFDERKKLDKDNKERQSVNDSVMQKIAEELGRPNPSGHDLVKYRLWQEQQAKCAYSLLPISVEQLFDKNEVQVDHIIPYSLCFDDSYNNKVLVLTKENQQKGNRLPLQYLDKTTKAGQDFIVWVNSYYARNRIKRAKLLAETVDSEDFIRRNLVDTQYITSLVANFLRDNLLFAPSKHNVPVRCVNGSITAYIRKRLDYKKDRSSDAHHAQDAILVATVTQKLIKKISDYEKFKNEYFYNKSQDKYVAKRTGEVFDSFQDFTLAANSSQVIFPYPWDNFKTEFEMWFASQPQSEYWLETREKMLPLYERGQVVKPLFVSRMKNYKISGAGHLETVRKIVERDGKSYAISKTPLDKLKLVFDKVTGEAEIENYYNKSSDLPLYNALLARLQSGTEKPFATPFYKPTSDGSPGALVRKVKKIEPITSFVRLENRGGAANNGDMVRIDVFTKEAKNGTKNYFFVPIYAVDFYKPQLPNFAVSTPKWIEMTPEYDFEFSLYRNDLVYIEHPKGMSGKSKDKESEKVYSVNNTWMYYNSANISTASILLESQDDAFFCEGIGIKTLTKLEKWEVDTLGNIAPAPRQERDTKTLRG